MAAKFKAITDYLQYIKVIEESHIVFDDVINKLVKEVYRFEEMHPEYRLNKYADILEKNNLKWDMNSMANADVTNMNGQGVMALLMGAVRAERFCDGALKGFHKKGCIRRWLERLQELDNE